MALKKEDQQKYQGAKGRVTRYFDAEATRDRTMKDAIKQDFWKGFWLKPHGHDAPPFNALPLTGAILFTIGGGVEYLGAPDHVNINSSSKAVVEHAIDTQKLGDNFYTAFTYENERIPYIVMAAADGMSVYQGVSIPSRSSLLNSMDKNSEGWEWTQLPEDDGKLVLEKAQVYYDAFTNDESAKVFKDVDYPFTNIKFDAVSIPYSESGSVKVSTEGLHVIAGEADGTSNEAISEAFQISSEHARMGNYQELSTEGLPTDGDFSEKSLNQKAVNMFRTLIPMWLLFAGSMGALNASHTAATGRRKKDKKLQPKF